MDKIACIHSVPDTYELKSYIEETYKIKINNIQLFLRGVNDTYFCVTSKNRFVIRVYRCNWRTTKEVEFECQFLNFLYSKDANSMRCISTLDGNLYSEISLPEGKRIVSMFSWCDGVNERILNSKELSEKSGTALANIHIVSKLFSPINIPDRNLQILEDLKFGWESIEKILFFHGKKIPVLKKIYNEVLSKLIHLFENKILSLGICHGDVHGGNIHHSNNRVSYIDFDGLGKGPVVFDLASYLWSIDLFELDKKLSHSFFLAYLKKNNLSQFEIESIPVFKLARDFWHLVIWSNNAKFLGCGWFEDHQLSKRIKLVEKLHHDTL